MLIKAHPFEIIFNIKILFQIHPLDFKAITYLYFKGWWGGGGGGWGGGGGGV